jgi:cysteine desulfurase
VQTIGKLPLNPNEVGIDLLAISAHKIYGPKGIGAIVIRKGTDIEKTMHGGKQERNRRGGTENVPLAVGLGKAIELSAAEMKEEIRRLYMLKERLRSKISETFEGILFNGHPAESLPHILNVSFDSKVVDIDGEVLLLNMDLHGIAVSSGSACTAGSIEPSHVLLAMGRDEKTASATIRFSFGRDNSEEEIDETVEVLKGIVQRIAKPVRQLVSV